MTEVPITLGGKTDSLHSPLEDKISGGLHVTRTFGDRLRPGKIHRVLALAPKSDEDSMTLGH